MSGPWSEEALAAAEELVEEAEAAVAAAQRETYTSTSAAAAAAAASSAPRVAELEQALLALRQTAASDAADVAAAKHLKVGRDESWSFTLATS